MPDLVWLMLAVYGVGIFVVPPAAFLLHRYVIRQKWRIAARRLGIDMHRRLLATGMSGVHEGFDVQIATENHSSKRALVMTTRYVVASTDFPRNIVIEPASFWSAPDRIRIGDAAFDEVVLLRGDLPTLLAIFDAETRRVVARFVAKHQARLVDGQLRSERGGRDMVPDWMVEHVHRAEQIARRLTIAPDEVPERLARNVADEEHPVVQRANLGALTSHYRETDACRAALDLAVRSGHAKLRIDAARVIGRPALRTVEAIAIDPVAADGLRLDAIDAFIPIAEDGEILPLLSRVLGNCSTHVVAGTLLLVGDHELHEARTLVREHLDAEESAVIAAAAEAMCAVGEESDTDALLGLLERNDTPIRLAALHALGAVGGLWAVERLLAHTQGVLTLLQLKNAARDAIRAIQDRTAHGADGGRLSVLTADDGGTLSVAPEGGTIAIADDTPPQES